MTSLPNMKAVDSVEIGTNGLNISRLGLGLAPIGNHHAFVPDEDAISLCRYAYDAGIRYFDAAPFYGNGLAEARFGAAMRWHERNSFALSSKVGRLLTPAPRETIDFKTFVNGLPFKIEVDYSYDATMRSIEGSINRLGLERIDIIYIHDIDRLTHGDDQPRQYKIAIEGAYNALAELRSAGLVRAIGVGCNEIEVFQSVLQDTDVDCLLVPGLYTLLDQSSSKTLFPECQRRGVSVIAGSVFNSGILVTGAVTGARYRYAEAGEEIIQRVKTISSICARYDTPIGAAALQFVLMHPAVKSVLAGARSQQQLDGILDFYKQEIPADLWNELRSAGVIE